ncbi:MAG: tetratricopeptide repeat protein [Caldilineaceae bacterium]
MLETILYAFLVAIVVSVGVMFYARRNKANRHYELIGYVQVAQKFQELLAADQGGYLGFHGVGGVGKTKLRKYLMHHVRRLCPHAFVVELTYDTAGEKDPWSSDQIDIAEARESDANILGLLTTMRAVVKEVVRNRYPFRDPDSLFLNYAQAEKDYRDYFSEITTNPAKSTKIINLVATDQSSVSNNTVSISNDISEIKKWLSSDDHRHQVISLVDNFMRDLNKLPSMRRKWPWQKSFASSLRLVLAIDGLDLVEQDSGSVVTLLRILKAQLGSSGILVCSGRAAISGLTDTYQLKGLSLNETKRYLSQRGIDTKIDQENIFHALKVKDEDGTNYAVPLILVLAIEYISTFSQSSKNEVIQNIIDYSKDIVQDRNAAEHLFRKYLERLRVIADKLDRFSDSQRHWYRQLHTLIYYGSMLVRYKPAELLHAVFSNFPQAPIIFPETTDFEQIQTRFKAEVIIDRDTLELHHGLRTIARAMLWSMHNDSPEGKLRDHVHKAAFEYHKQYNGPDAPEGMWHLIAIEPDAGLRQLFDYYILSIGDSTRANVLYNLSIECANRISNNHPAHRWIHLIQAADIILNKHPLPTIVLSTLDMDKQHQQALEHLRTLRRLPELTEYQQVKVAEFLTPFIVRYPRTPSEWGDKAWILYQKGSTLEAADTAISWANSHSSAGNYRRCLEICDLATTWCQSIPRAPEHWQPRIETIQAYVLFMQGHLKKALELAASAAEQFHNGQKAHEEAQARYYYGRCLVGLSRHEDAIEQLTAAMALYKLGTPNLVMQAEIMYRLGEVDQSRGYFDYALTKFHNAQEMIQGQENIEFSGNIKFSIGHLYLRSNLTKAKHYLSEALDLFQRSKSQYSIAIANQALGEVFYQENDLDAALKHYKDALEIFLTLGVNIQVANTHYSLARILKAQNLLVNAEYHLDEAIRGFLSLNNETRVADCNRYSGQIQHTKKNYSSAESAYLYALDLYRKQDNWFGVAWTLCDLHLTYTDWFTSNRASNKVEILRENILIDEHLAKATLEEAEIVADKLQSPVEQEKISKWIHDRKENLQKIGLFKEPKPEPPIQSNDNPS